MSNLAQEPDTSLARILAALETLPARLNTTIDDLPAELRRERVLATKQALKFVNSSPANWRRMRRAGIAPQPVLIGLRRQGYTVGSLLDYIAARTLPAAA